MRDAAVERFNVGQKGTLGAVTVSIYMDTDACNPREDDNFGRIVCWHRRYTLGDGDTTYYNGKWIADKWDGPEEFQEWAMAKRQRGIVVLPLFLMDHSGISISTRDFGDTWDSGYVGYIYATREMILANWGGKRVSKALIERTRKLLVAEVETYDMYLRGDIYGYIVRDAAGEDLDSCWGFFGMQDAMAEGQAAGEYAVAKRKADYFAALDREATSAGDVPVGEPVVHQ